MLVNAFSGILQQAVIILMITGTLQLSKAQSGSIIINQNNNAGTLTRQVDSSVYSSIWTFAKTSTGWASIINYTVSAPCPGTPTVYYAGQTYHTVQIGNQCWLVENLNVGIMIDGNQEQTNNGIIEKYCYYDDSAACATYGGLYQWAEAVQYQNGASNSTNSVLSGNVQGICPGGWHIPSLNEFDTLTNTVNKDGNALKAIGQGYAQSAGTGTNLSGFSALLAGYHYYFINYYSNSGQNSYFWSSTGYSPIYACNPLFLDLNDGHINQNEYLKGDGFSVRCVKD
jgi:uncharacterized protein (TIGR02145 family)